jgi:8-oxo-dGTP pyrophosphatase MutT (NUDIX family)
VSEVKKAACIVVLRSDGMLIGAATREDTDQFGLPGGKVNPNESFVDGAIRELYEESGFKVEKKDIEFLYEAIDVNGYDTVTFIHKRIFDQWDDAPDIKPIDNINADWISFRKLLDGPFKVYNTVVVTKLIARFCKLMGEKQ